MKKILVVALAFSFTFCTKDHFCECSNPRGVYATYNINDTEKKVQEKGREKCGACSFATEEHCELK